MENIKEEYEIKKLKKEINIFEIKSYGMYIFIVFELILCSIFIFKYSGLEIELFKEKNKIAIISLNEEITSKVVNEIIEKIEIAKTDKKYKEILFIMNSPGGSPSASEELSEYLKEINKTKKITMYIEGMAASGGYYIASSIKPLKANKNAVIGSIGVILTHYNGEELAKKIGIKEDNLAAGEFKQPISIFKEIDSKNKEYLKDRVLTPMYNNFINSIVENRQKSKEEITKLAEGQIFLANDERIKDILIDEITNLYKVKQEILDRNKESAFEEIEIKKPFLKELMKAKLDINIENLETKIK